MPIKSGYAVAAVVASAGAAGWVVYRKGQREKLVSLLKLWPQYRAQAKKLAAEHVDIFGTTSADKAYEEITGEEPTTIEQLLRRFGKTGEKAADLIETAEGYVTAAENKVASASNVAADYTQEGTWYDWAKKKTGLGESALGDSDWDSIVQNGWGQSEGVDHAGQQGGMSTVTPLEPYYVAPTSLPSSAQQIDSTKPPESPKFVPGLRVIQGGPATGEELKKLNAEKQAAKVKSGMYLAALAAPAPLAAYLAHQSGRSAVAWGLGVAVVEAAIILNGIGRIGRF